MPKIFDAPLEFPLEAAGIPSSDLLPAQSGNDANSTLTKKEIKPPVSAGGDAPGEKLVCN